MSECIGDGCTYPGCSGQNAAAVNVVGRVWPEEPTTPAATLQSALIARQIASEGAQSPTNRAARRRREREARRGRRSG